MLSAQNSLHPFLGSLKTMQYNVSYPLPVLLIADVVSKFSWTQNEQGFLVPKPPSSDGKPGVQIQHLVSIMSHLEK